MTTLETLIENTHIYLSTGTRSQKNQLAAAEIAGTTTLTTVYAANGISAGIYLGVDLEVFYVWSVTGQIITVTGGQLGSTPADHADNAVIHVNPKFSNFAIANLINDELLDLSSPSNGLFQVKTMSFIWNSVIRSYDLSGATNLIDVISVHYKTPMPDQMFPPIRNWHLEQNQTDAYFPSTYALTVERGDGYPGQPVYVQYKAQFSPLVNLTDDVTTVSGLPATCVDIPVLGAGIRLVAGLEIQRNSLQAESDSKRVAEVPAGAILNSSKVLMMLRANRIASESARLQVQYPRQGPLR